MMYYGNEPDNTGVIIILIILVFGIVGYMVTAYFLGLPPFSSSEDPAPSPSGPSSTAPSPTAPSPKDSSPEEITPMPATPPTPPSVPYIPEARPMYIPKNMTLFEAQFERNLNPSDPCPQDISCRRVRPDKKDDMLWYVRKIYNDVKSVTLDYLNSLPGFQEMFGNLTIVHENPLTVLDGSFELVLDDAPGLDPYIIKLFLFKKLGRSLPKPDPNADYRDPDYIP